MSETILVVYRNASDAEPYAGAVKAAGAWPRMEEARHGLAIGQCSGLLLTGGSDVNPALYGEIAGPETEAPDDERDAVEATLIEEALARDIPLLAICRGMQILNVRLGGSLVQHLPTVAHHRVKTPHNKGLPAHTVAIEPGARLAGIAQRESWDVNSRHHQAVARLGHGLQVCATDPYDGVIEAMELPGRRYVLAVQWHPENQAVDDPEQRKIFQSFVAAL